MDSGDWERIIGYRDFRNVFPSDLEIKTKFGEDSRPCTFPTNGLNGNPK